jgi:hypothetical protein
MFNESHLNTLGECLETVDATAVATLSFVLPPFTGLI